MIGDQIKQLRLQKGLSLTELAERAGVAKSYISSIERNIQTNPSINFLEKVAAILEIPVEKIIHEEPMSSRPVDREWMELVHAAMKSGVSKDDFKKFLELKNKK